MKPWTLLYFALCILAPLLIRPAHAVEIEGVDPSGVLRTVGVTSTGRFKVDTSTGLAQHVIVDGGTVTVHSDPAQPLTVQTASGGSGFVVTAATAATTVTAQTPVSNSAVLAYPADAARVQGVLCNADVNGLDMWVGGVAVSSTTGVLVQAGSCLSPDQPDTFVGALYAISTAPLTSSYIYFKP